MHCDSFFYRDLCIMCVISTLTTCLSTQIISPEKSLTVNEGSCFWVLTVNNNVEMVLSCFSRYTILLRQLQLTVITSNKTNICDHLFPFWISKVARAGRRPKLLLYDGFFPFLNDNGNGAYGMLFFHAQQRQRSTQHSFGYQRGDVANGIVIFQFIVPRPSCSSAREGKAAVARDVETRDGQPSKIGYRLDRGICMAPTVPPSTFRITPVHHDPARLLK
jgi:hypothetical protein